MLLWIWVADESATRCCTSARLDVKTVKARVKHEGISFLTISLPSFGKDFEKSLDQGYVDRDLFQGFSWRAGLPRFLGGFLDLVFDRASGVLLDNPSIDSILAVRQLTLMYGKILMETTKRRNQEAIRGYIQCEKEVREADRRISSQQWDDFRRISALLFRDEFVAIDNNVFDRNLFPKHGPGSTADSILGNKKYSHVNTWPIRLQHLFPREEYYFPNNRVSQLLDEGVAFLEPGEELPAKVILVPKTMKTPRIIAKEPVVMQYAQQSVLDNLLSAIRRNDNLRSMLGFKDQDVNQRLAQKGSLDGSLATLDLSDASDRVSNQHVRNMLADHVFLHDMVDACRSRKADVDGHGVVRLAKFASMGSALCFPMEAMVFLTLIFMGIEKELSTPLRLEDVNRLRGQVRVYGDDIIVPVRFVHAVISALSDFGLVVNRRKSFWNGKFRESCGAEFYNGSDVSIVRFRREFPQSQRDAPEVESLVAFRNHMYFRGYWATCARLDEVIRRVISDFPVVLPTSQIIGRHSFLGYEVQKFDDDLHAPLVRGYVNSSKPPRDNLDGPGALMKCLLMLERKHSSDPAEVEISEASTMFSNPTDLPVGDEEHLARSGRPKVTRITRMWRSPF